VTKTRFARAVMRHASNTLAKCYIRKEKTELSGAYSPPHPPPTSTAAL